MDTKPDRNIIQVRQSVTRANDRTADKLRKDFHDRGIWVLNLVSSPGAGKTSLIERTLEAFKSSCSILVIEGDPHTRLDSDRINAMGVRGIQINTRGGCHLDARMIGQVLEKTDLDTTDMIIIENVGNLLCPAAWDLGQNHTVVVASLTEGEDKPLKYPEAFIRSQALVVNKIDLKPYLPKSSENLSGNALQVNPSLTVFNVSCTTGTGLADWFQWVCTCSGQTRE
ncbi:hydrogenase nickel incorporation protein HypB [Desulfospira joergensenii]|uniref:hydrogenase nickel incorporation protein HypB n=1 Tax=Desulfospira joergensenii TaxID=53329 RepID=UPI00041B55F4|nr:hydrogenase nickel incorporation protein HypB [Desulfospira joergensenii]